MRQFSIEVGTPTSRHAAAAGIVVVVALSALPLFASRGLIQDLFFILTMLTLAQCWNLLAGYAGLVSVGQQAFVGIGAYALFATVILTGIDPVAALAAALLAAALAALMVAFFVFRLSGAYFAIGTWVLAEVMRLGVAQWKQVGGGTGTSLPRSASREMLFTETIQDLLGVRAAAARDILTYWLALALVLVTIGGIYWLLRSRHGLALAAVRDNRAAAVALGVGTKWMNWLVFTATAAVTGITGGLIYLQKLRISPDAAFNVVDWTAYVIFIVVIGGIGTIEGPIIGVLILFFLQNYLADYGSWYLLLLGLLGIGVMLVAPRGIWGLFADRTGIQLFPVRRRLLLRDSEEN